MQQITRAGRKKTSLSSFFRLFCLWKPSATGVLTTAYNVVHRPHWSMDWSSTWKYRVGVSGTWPLVIVVGGVLSLLLDSSGFASSPSSWMEVGWESTFISGPPNSTPTCASCWGLQEYWDWTLAWPSGPPNFLNWELFWVTSFRSVDQLTVIIEPLMTRMVYGNGSNSGLALFDLFCVTRALSQM